MEQFFQQLVNGLNVGSSYAVVALGFGLVFGVMRVINLAHPEIFMLGAYLTFLLVTALGVNSQSMSLLAGIGLYIGVLFVVMSGTGAAGLTAGGGSAAGSRGAVCRGGSAAGWECCSSVCGDAWPRRPSSPRSQPQRPSWLSTYSLRSRPTNPATAPAIDAAGLEPATCGTRNHRSTS